VGLQPRGLRWGWPPYGAVGFNLVLVAIGLVVHGHFSGSDSGAGVMAWFAGLVLLIGAVIGLVGSLVVLALLNLYELRGGRWLLAARIVAGLVAGFALSTLGLFVGLFLLPTAAALVSGCIARPAGDPALAGRWFPES
jgi:hypothetical protein